MPLTASNFTKKEYHEFYKKGDVIGMNIDCTSNTANVEDILFVESIPALLTPLHYVYIFAFFLLPIIIFFTNKNRCMSNRPLEP
jgi:hypothetical protein